MSRKKRLTLAQNHQRVEGLRVLARIIARHYLEHPDLYPDPPGAEGAVPPVQGKAHGDGKAVRKEDGA